MQVSGQPRKVPTSAHRGKQQHDWRARTCQRMLSHSVSTCLAISLRSGLVAVSPWNRDMRCCTSFSCDQHHKEKLYICLKLKLVLLQLNKRLSQVRVLLECCPATLTESVTSPRII